MLTVWFTHATVDDKIDRRVHNDKQATETQQNIKCNRNMMPKTKTTLIIKNQYFRQHRRIYSVYSKETNSNMKVFLLANSKTILKPLPGISFWPYCFVYFKC